MFAVVTLKNSLNIKVVPIDWIYGLDLADTVNNGVNNEVTVLVFYSKNRKHANFNLPINIQFNSEDDGCYLARLNKYFRKYWGIFQSFIFFDGTT